jgi:predicted glycosyltransferase
VMRPRVLIWVQHLLGIGHLSRAATLAKAMMSAGMDVVIASGGEAVPVIDVGDAVLQQLPSARATDIFFKVLHDSNDRQIDDDWKNRRREATLDVYRNFAPNLLLTELFPYGRRQFRFELEPLLEEAKRDGCKVVASVRDILVAPAKPERLEEMLARVKAWYDLTLVHGDPDLVPFERTFPHMPQIADKVRYTGYVVDSPEDFGGDDGVEEILISAGGGGVAEPLLRAAMAARPLTKVANKRWRFLVGYNLSDEIFNDLRNHSCSRVIVERARKDFPILLKRCKLSVSQGGYNTVMETLAAGARAVIAPYAGGLETEQTLRAEALQSRGALQLVREEDLSPEKLAAAIDRTLNNPPSSAVGVKIDGAQETARILQELVGA